MKARVKSTGEVFEIASYATIPMECCDSFGEPLCFCFDEVEILSEGNDLKESEASDYWTRLEHQYAGMAMQGLVTRGEVLGSSVQKIARDIAEISCEVAHALVEKFRNAENPKELEGLKRELEALNIEKTILENKVKLLKEERK